MSSGVISVTGVRAYGYHGVLPEERRDGQPFVVDALVSIDWPPSDSLSDTVDYTEIADRVVARITGQPRQLIEQLATDIAEDLVTMPGVRRARVRVHKPQAPLGAEFADLFVQYVATR